MVNDEILTSIKKVLAIPGLVVNFDEELKIHINSCLRTLNELGIGKTNYVIPIDGPGSWLEFLGTDDSNGLDQISTYVYLRVRLLFDPPTHSFLVESFNRQSKELEWRLEVWNRELENKRKEEIE